MWPLWGSGGHNRGRSGQCRSLLFLFMLINSSLNLFFYKCKDLFSNRNYFWYSDSIVIEFLNYYFFRYSEHIKNSSSQSLGLIRKNREKIIKFFALSLKRNLIPTKKYSVDFDRQRQNIDTIVIHHSGKKRNIWEIEAIHMVNLYIKDFLNKDVEHYLRPLDSGHIRNGKTTFCAYHYLVDSNGTVKKLLSDKYIGWHCGNWEYNTKSIAICINDNLENKSPNKKVINTLKNLIRKYQYKANISQILGHCEIKPTTTCPGKSFLGEKGWKNLLY